MPKVRFGLLNCIDGLSSALQVPEDSRLANGLKKAEEERIKQQQDIKKHTIDLANRQRIEEVQQEILGIYC